MGEVFYLDNYRRPANDMPILDNDVYSLLMTRLSDMNHLAEIREWKMNKGRLRNFIFIYGSMAIQIYGIDDGINMAESENQLFVNPLDEDQIAYVLGDLALRAESGDMYKYKNTTIIQRLGITYEEQASMRVLRMPDLEKRLHYRKWSVTSWAEKKRILAEAERDHPGATKSELARVIGISPSTLAKWYKNLENEAMTR